MSRRTAAATTALALVFALAACSGDEDEPTSGSTTTRPRPTTSTTVATTVTTRPPLPAPPTTVVNFDDCGDARAAGAGPLRRGQPGYSADLDRDGDGVACEATGRASTTTTAPATFRSDLRAGLMPPPGDPVVDALLAYAEAECALFDEVVAADAAVPDGELLALALGVAYGPDGLGGQGYDDAVVDVVMRATGDHVCPEHGAIIDAYIDARP